MRRFLFYSHDGLGLGHVRRNIAVATALSEVAPDASILVLTSAEDIASLGAPAARARGQAARPASLGPEGARGGGRDLPAGGAPRRRGPVRSRRRARPGARAHSRVGRTGCPRAPGRPRRHAERRSRVARPRALRADSAGLRAGPRLRTAGPARPRRRLELPAGARGHRVPYCGYVVSQSLASQLGASRPSSRRPRVLATVGGGDDGYPILDTFIAAAEGNGWDAMIVAGAHCPQDRSDLLRSRASAAGVAYRDFVPSPLKECSSLDALVCMGGYNTLAEVAASGVPAVCIPRREPTRDRLIRARAWEFHAVSCAFWTRTSSRRISCVRRSRARSRENAGDPARDSIWAATAVRRTTSWRSRLSGRRSTSMSSRSTSPRSSRSQPLPDRVARERYSTSAMLTLPPKSSLPIM